MEDNIMKRFLSMLLVAVLLVGCLSTVAFAAGTKEVKLTITVKGPLSNFSGKVTSSHTITAITGITANAGSGKVSYANSENVDSVSFTVTVSVPDDICGETVSVSFKSTEADKHVYDEEGNREYKSISLSGSNSQDFPHAWGDWSETAGENCLTPGKKTRTCSNCGDTQTEDLAVGPHDWGKWEVTTPATCDEDGVETRVCSHDASHTETRPISKDTVEHTPDMSLGLQSDKNGHWYICSVCGDKHQSEAHDNECEDNGDTHKVVCKDCGYVTDPNAKHDYKWETTKDKHHQVCKDCGHETKWEKHSFKNGKCACGRKESTGNLPVPDMGDTTPYGTYNAIVFVIAMIAVFSVYALVSKRKSVK